MSHHTPLLPIAVFLVASSVARMLPAVFTVSNFECADMEKGDHRVPANQPERENRCGNAKATLGLSPPCFPKVRQGGTAGSRRPEGWMEEVLFLLLPSGHHSISPVFLQWGLTGAELGGGGGGACLRSPSRLWAEPRKGDKGRAGSGC